MKQTWVKFTTTDQQLQKLMDAAQEKCLGNIKNFGGKRVLIEGGGYQKIWLETQPMGGAMYAKRDLEIAVNNQKMFIGHQREDGRLPGSIECRGSQVIPQFDKFQGFSFPEEAIDVWFLTDRDESELQELQQALIRFDEYLWSVRDSDGDGCLETWCLFDTGEDGAVRYGDAPNAWTADVPPTGCERVPIASMDVMSYSYACRKAAYEIAGILGDSSAEQIWKERAEEVKTKIAGYLWDEAKGALFDKDRNHQQMPELIHNTLRAMYWGSISPEMADKFVQRHLTNPDEFWTNMPLPSVAVNDPAFCNITTNNWSGQCEALTYQRAIRALENYGYHKLIPKLGQKLFDAIGDQCQFVQQYDPFTMEPSKVSLEGEQDAYGPAMLSVMEYCSRMYGVHIVRDQIIWGTYGLSGDAPDSTYIQGYGDHTYELRLEGIRATGLIDDREVFSCKRGLRIVTNMQGDIKGMDELE